MAAVFAITRFRGGRDAVYGMAGGEVMGGCCPDLVAVRSSAHNILSLYQRLQ
jgi:hypothetical protein